MYSQSHASELFAYVTDAPYMVSLAPRRGRTRRALRSRQISAPVVYRQLWSRNAPLIVFGIRSGHHRSVPRRKGQRLYRTAGQTCFSFAAFCQRGREGPARVRRCRREQSSARAAAQRGAGRTQAARRDLPAPLPVRVRGPVLVTRAAAAHRQGRRLATTRAYRQASASAVRATEGMSDIPTCRAMKARIWRPRPLSDGAGTPVIPVPQAGS